MKSISGKGNDSNKVVVFTLEEGENLNPEEALTFAPQWATEGNYTLKTQDNREHWWSIATPHKIAYFWEKIKN